MGAKNEIYAKGIAEGLVASLSEEEISCGERFEELVSLIVDTADVSEDIARYYADRIWERKKEEMIEDVTHQILEKHIEAFKTLVNAAEASYLCCIFQLIMMVSIAYENCLLAWKRNIKYDFY